MFDLKKFAFVALCFVIFTTCSAQIKTPKNMVFEEAEFVSSVLTHVLYHELGHAVFKEFRIPVLANEENMADAFATAYIVKHDRDNAIDIITRRAVSWMLEDSEVDPQDYDFMGEHELDIRRAYNVLCQAYGADPAEWYKHFTWVGFSENDLNGCSETSPAIESEWEQILDTIRSDSPENDVQFSVQYGSSRLNDYVRDLGVLESFAEEAKKFDWPFKTKLVFTVCQRGAYWSKQHRTITLCDGYVERFIEQEKTIEKLLSN